jgi:hypothetical protein
MVIFFERMDFGLEKLFVFLKKAYVLRKEIIVGSIVSIFSPVGTVVPFSTAFHIGLLSM